MEFGVRNLWSKIIYKVPRLWFLFICLFFVTALQTRLIILVISNTNVYRGKSARGIFKNILSFYSPCSVNKADMC